MRSLVIIIYWIDDLLIIWNKENVKNTKIEIIRRFNCEDGRELKDHVGCKLDWEGDAIKINQPILIQSLKDEFDVAKVPKWKFPADLGRILVINEDNELPKERLKCYLSGIGKLLCVITYRRVEVHNTVREVSKIMNKNTGECHIKRTHRVMQCMAYAP